MSASEQVTGPVAVFVSVASVANVTVSAIGVSLQVPVTTPTFYGWGLNAPKPRFMPHYENLMSDLSGTQIPHDKIFEGDDAQVTMETTVFDENVLAGMMRYAKGAAPGTNGPLERGTLMKAEGAVFQLWLSYQFSKKPFMVAANMRAGYHFYGAMLDNAVERTIGTTANGVLHSWYCGPILVPVNGSGQVVAGSQAQGVAWRCWDHDMSAVINLPTPINRP